MRHDDDLLAAIIVQVLVRGHEIAVHDAADNCHLLQRSPLPLCSGRELDDVIHGEGSLGGSADNALGAGQRGTDKHYANEVTQPTSKMKTSHDDPLSSKSFDLAICFQI